jgi:hypothetical protein
MPSKFALRGIAPPFPKQLEVLEYIFRPSPKTKSVDLVCGRGFGKSVFAIIVAIKALCRGPRETVLFLEPDWKRIRTVFLKKWEQIVPPELYVHIKTERLIIWLPTGAKLYYSPRNITGNYGASADGQLGQDTTVVIDDEAALRCSFDFYMNTFATIREPSEAPFYLTLTTPRIGIYQRLVEMKEHKLFTGTSFDNIYRPGYAEQLLTRMTPEMAEREVYGKFISLSGRVWDMCDTKNYWPNGNRDDARFRHGTPYILAGDLGVYASWFIIQAQHGRECIVAEYHPDGGGTYDHVNFVLGKYGQPIKIITGHDLGTRSVAASTSPIIEIRRALSERRLMNVQITHPGRNYMDKSIQYGSLSYLFKNRLLTISDSLIQDGNTKRGVHYMIDVDEWPDPGSSTLFLKDAKQGSAWCQDARDALFYFAACQHPSTVAGVR